MGAEPAMKARPILFSGAMIRALLDDLKDKTRRVVKLDVPEDADEVFFWSGDDLRAAGHRNVAETGCWARRNGRDGYLRFLGPCPYGVPGDLLWVRESCWIYGEWHEDGRTPTGRRRWRFKAIGQQVRFANPRDEGEPIAHLGGGPGWSYRNSIHMPRWASRITLRITDVRVKRLNDISEEDAQAEGVRSTFGEPFDPSSSLTDRRRFELLWNHINGPGSWDANPWVWALTLKVHHQNVDAFLKAREAA